MSTVPKDKTRSQQAKPDTKGTPTFNWQMSNTTLGDTVKLVIPPMHILPIIFVPGIMGSNLKDTKGNKVWRLDSTMGQPIGLAWMWAKKNAGQRQKLLHPSRTSVDSNGAVPKTPVGSIQDKSEFKTRGWGEVGQTSYHEFLLWLETTMNDRSYNPAEWNDFFYTSVSATPQPGAPRQVPKLYPGITMTMSGLPFYSEEQEMTAPVLSDDLLLRARCRFPVYACGYNWLDTNLNAANQLKERISSVIAQNNRGYFRCEQVILVTHSMGGLVARACSELAGAQGKIAGIVHGVMPAVGAAVAYRRCKIGMKDEDFGASLVIGSDGKEVTAVFSQAPGALQLLPSQDYHPKWLDIKGPDGKIIESLPASDPYAEIYLRKDQWWGLVREEWLSPDNGEPISWGEFSQNIGKAKAFHQSLSGKYHPNTFVFYGAGDKKQASFEKIQWTMKKGMQPETGK
ncbi:esterase/lipase family protein, partial [Undibacterium sp.]|uniref:esterase/lipase family protein n=1 Tax=Undibacterium sp. TaxID=1914977 RepID=UPI00374D2A98